MEGDHLPTKVRDERSSDSHSMGTGSTSLVGVCSALQMQTFAMRDFKHAGLVRVDVIHWLEGSWG